MSFLYSDPEWSCAIDLSSDYDTFASIPQFGDVKIHLEQVAHTVHLFIDPVGRAEVSAREIRSRIEGGKEITTTVVQMMSSLDQPLSVELSPSSPVSPGPKSPPTRPTIPQPSVYHIFIRVTMQD